MLDFILAALPFVAAGVAVAVVVVHIARGKKKEDGKDADYSLEGMCLGMCFGVMFGSMSSLDLGTCLSLGMLAGLAIGMCMKKKDD